MKQFDAINRRIVIGGAIATGAAGLAQSITSAVAQTPAPSGGRLPARENLVIRSAYVMTMDAGLGDIAEGDVHINNGSIVAVGKKLDAEGATLIDGRDMIVLPGFIETHWHMWNTIMRGMAGDKPELGYFPTTAALGKVFQASDMYQGTRLATAEAINGGITFVHSWCHNIRTLEYAEQDLRALRDAGIRAQFTFGWWQDQQADQPMRSADLEHLHRNWKDYSNDGLLSLGFGWRGVPGARDAAKAGDLYKREIAAVRALGIPVTVHANSSGMGQVAQYMKDKILGKDLQGVSPIRSTPEEIQGLAEAGSTVSFAPVVGMRIGRGFPQTGKFIAAGIPIGLGIDDTVLGGNADMFAIMKLVRNSENANAQDEFKLLPRRVLEIATIEGARSMGVDKLVGSLVPGKRADLIMISTEDVNLGVFTAPANMIVDAGQPSNVDTVIIDGRILKRQGKLMALDKRQVISEANAALTAIRKRANWW